VGPQTGDRFICVAVILMFALVMGPFGLPSDVLVVALNAQLRQSQTLKQGPASPSTQSQEAPLISQPYVLSKFINIYPQGVTYCLRIAQGIGESEACYSLAEVICFERVKVGGFPLTICQLQWQDGAVLVARCCGTGGVKHA